MPTASLFLLMALGADPAPGADRQPIPVEEVRQVVAAVVGAAEENAALAKGQLEGDALLDFYVRRAAAAAREEHASAQAFLVALGVALDHGDLLRNNLLTRFYLKGVESDEARQRRLKALGKPTLRGRRDWVQHFAVSAALAAFASPELAEQAGITKELLDARPGGSGFSFGDLAADYAGVGFGKALLEGDAEGTRLRRLAEEFRGDDYLPASAKDLEEGIPRDRLEKAYGGSKDPRLLRACEKVRKQVEESPGFKRADKP